MAHEHGPHKCYCPECNYETEVGAYVKCNSLVCPSCGARLRARETGALRSASVTARSRSIATKIGTASIACPICKYPIPEPTSVGEQVKCSYCGAISEAITQGDINPALVGIVCFGLGVILSSAVKSFTKAGSEWLDRKARQL